MILCRDDTKCRNKCRMKLNVGRSKTEESKRRILRMQVETPNLSWQKPNTCE